MSTGTCNNIMKTVAMLAADVCCASCGAAQVNGIELKPCPECDLAHYCGDKCQNEHLTEHEAVCKERAAQLREELLFTQPESSYLGDCPICFLPCPLNDPGFPQLCCGKTICAGCYYQMSRSNNLNCPFCRKSLSMLKDYTKRVDLNNPNALLMMAVKSDMDGDSKSFYDFTSRAARLGDASSHYSLAFLYNQGTIVDKDEAKEIYHLEEAAIAGHGTARYKLGLYEYEEREKFDKGVLHFKIGAKLGDNDSIKALRICYENGHVSKDDFATALRAHQAAVDATKSPEREAASQFDERKVSSPAKL